MESGNMLPKCTYNINRKTMIKKVKWLTVLMIVFSHTVHSQMRTISYEEAIQIALGESYTVQYYKEAMEATRFSYLYTKANFKPLLNFDLSAPSWVEELSTIYQADGLPVYNSTSMLRAGGNLNFKYVLPTGGDFSLTSNMRWENYRTTLSELDNRVLKRDQVYSRFALSFDQPVFTANILKENMKAAALRYRWSTSYFTRTQMDIVYNVTAKFYQVYKLDYEHKINREQFNNSQEVLRITKLKQETGNLAEGELLIAEVNAAQNEVLVMGSEGKLNTAKDEFKLLIGLDLKEEIELDAEMEFETFAIDMQRAIEEALANRMEIQQDEVDIELQEIEVKRAKRERELKGKISAYYDFTGLSTKGEGTVGQLIGSSFQNMTDRPSNRGIALTLAYPIADWGRAKNKVKSEQVRLKQYELSLENEKRFIESEIREIVRSVQEAEKRFRVNQRNQEVATKSYRISLLQFENGDMTTQELFLAQERLSQVQLAYIESYITYRLSVANLSRKTMFDFENNRSYLIN